MRKDMQTIENWEDTVYTFIQKDSESNTHLRQYLSEIEQALECNIIWGYDSDEGFSMLSCFACVVDRTLLDIKSWNNFLNSFNSNAEKWIRIIVVDNEGEMHFREAALEKSRDLMKLNFQNSPEIHSSLNSLLDKDSIQELNYILDLNQMFAEVEAGKATLTFSELKSNPPSRFLDDDNQDDDRSSSENSVDVISFMLSHNSDNKIFTYLQPEGSGKLLLESVNEWEWGLYEKLNSLYKQENITEEKFNEELEKNKVKVVDCVSMNISSIISFSGVDEIIVCIIDRDAMGIEKWNLFLEDNAQFAECENLHYILFDNCKDAVFPANNYTWISPDNMIEDHTVSEANKLYTAISAVLTRLDAIFQR